MEGNQDPRAYGHVVGQDDLRNGNLGIEGLLAVIFNFMWWLALSTTF